MIFRSRSFDTVAFRIAQAVICVAASTVSSWAVAQYTYDPSAADEQQGGVRYFGATKDSNGALISGASILVSSGRATFVFVTDDQGRFRGNLPTGTKPSEVTLKCWKQGYASMKLTQRLGPTGVRPTVQVDCTLRQLRSGDSARERS